MDSSSANSFVNEYTSLEKEIKRLNHHVKTLREQKKKVASNLYKYMVSRALSEVGGIPLKKVTPPKKRKTEQEKRKEAIELFAREGVDLPDVLYDKLKQTQKAKEDPFESEKELY